MITSRWWWIQWRCPHCRGVFNIPSFDTQKDHDRAHVCPWCNGEVWIPKDFAKDLVMKFPRQDITRLTQRDEPFRRDKP